MRVSDCGTKAQEFCQAALAACTTYLRIATLCRFMEPRTVMLLGD